MFFSRKRDLWVSGRVWKIKQNLLNSLSWERNAQKQAQWHWLFSQAEVWSLKTKKSGFDVRDIEMEKQVSSYWKKQDKRVRRSKINDGKPKKVYDW